MNMRRVLEVHPVESGRNSQPAQSPKFAPVSRIHRQISRPALVVKRFGRMLVALAMMTGSLLLLADAPVTLRILAGAATYVTTLTVVGGLRFRRGELPELVP